MNPRFWCLLAVLPALVALNPARGFATEIKTRRGEVFSGVKIVGNDATSIEITGPRGKFKILRTSIAEIDGIKIAAPAPAATPGTAASSATAPAQPVAAPSASALPSAARPIPSRPPVSILVMPTPAGLPVDEPLPGDPRASAAPATAGGENLPPPGDGEFVWDADWVRWTVAAVLALWIATLLLAWLDLRGQPGKSRRWLYVAGLAPILGYAVFLFATRRPAGKKPRRGGSPSDKPVEFEFLDENGRPVAIKPGAEASGIQNAKDILNDALLDRSSDVHIEPTGKEYRVRFRVDGMLYPRMKFGNEEGMRLVSAMKSLAQIDIAERRKAQDGRFGGRRGTREVDFRVATTPSVFGEKLVVRILDSKTGLRGLNDLGMTETMMDRFSQVIQSRNGMILATGPTGSGKTSTLYAALTQLDAVGLNLVTIEDPVEYQLAGATQIPVNVRAGVTYESGLRSVLRQDPDVILVGEMRDREAAQIALRSALTGHLVFSSLHTQNAVGSITRLEEIGIERHLLASSLFVIIGQRLVRVLCPHCREGYACTGDELVGVGIELPADAPIFRAKGCRRCDATGYLGRTGVFEMLIFDEELRQAVNDGMGESELYTMAHDKGYRGYREDAAMKVLLGVTTVDEVLKAI